MSKPETLHDAVYQTTFLSDALRQQRAALVAATRFVLDEGMSRLLVHLAPKTANEADKWRRLSRLPHRLTWIEQDGTARESEEERLFGNRRENLAKIGWLLEQDEAGTSVRATFFGKEEDGMVGSSSHSVMWNTEDEAPNFALADTAFSVPLIGEQGNSVLATVSEAVVGLQGYHSRFVGAAAYHDGWQHGVDRKPILRGPVELDKSLGYFSAELRYVWALLATINQIPVIREHKAIARGFMARREYRKYLDHVVIKLDVPTTRDIRKVARNIIAVTRRRAHMVRGHWRKDWRHPGNLLWIGEHQRGDAALGFVTHEYTVRHKPQSDRPQQTSALVSQP